MPYGVNVAHEERVVDFRGPARKERLVVEGARLDVVHGQRGDGPVGRAELELA